MADPFDQASDNELRDRELAIKYQRELVSKQVRPAGRGYCLNPTCGEDFDGDMTRLFCGPSCAAEHHRRAA